jgi:hypothetical protein
MQNPVNSYGHVSDDIAAARELLYAAAAKLGLPECLEPVSKPF